MTPPMAVLLVLLAAFSLSPATHAGRYVDIDHGYGLSTHRPQYLDNNPGRLVPYGMGELRHDRRAAPGRGHLKHDIHDRRHKHQSPWVGRALRHKDGHPGFRYSLRPFDGRHRGRHRDDFGRFSIRIGGDHDRGEVIFFNFPVSPRHGH